MLWRRQAVLPVHGPDPPGGHDQSGCIVHRAERFGDVPEENPDRRAGEMFLGSRERAITPHLTQRLREWRQHAL